MAVLLPLPGDPRFQQLIDFWPTFEQSPAPYPRSEWLRSFEDALRIFYPSASSRDLSVTARHYFPGYLAAGHDVP